MNNFKYNPIKMTPFKWFVLENFPFIEEDFDSLTSYGLWCKLKEYFDKVATKTNEMGTQVESLTNAFNTLKDYVDNYFDNLDVQDEINNKLDIMAQDGTLATLLNINTALFFDTVSDMKNATNITSGKLVFTKGYYSIADGGSAKYSTRQKTVNDTEDNGSIIFLQNNLVAQLIIENDTVNVKQFGAKIDSNTDDLQSLINCLAFMRSNNIFKMIIPETGYNLLISDTLEITHSNIFLDIRSNIVLTKTTNISPTDNLSAIYIHGSSETPLTNITIDGNNISKIDGNGNHVTQNLSETSGLFSAITLRTAYINNFILRNIEITNGYKDCFTNGNSKNVIIENCVFSNSYRDNGCSISQTDIDNIDKPTIVRNCLAINCRDFGFTAWLTKNIIFENCQAKNCGNEGATIYDNTFVSEGGGFSAETPSATLLQQPANAHATFINCSATNCYNHGWYSNLKNTLLEKCNVSNIYSTSSSSSRRGCAVYSEENIGSLVIKDCNFRLPQEGQCYYFIFFQGNNLNSMEDLTRYANIELKNCYFNGEVSNAFLNFYDCDNVEVENCNFVDAETNKYGIHIFGQSTSNKIKNLKLDNININFNILTENIVYQIFSNIYQKYTQTEDYPYAIKTSKGTNAFFNGIFSIVYGSIVDYLIRCGGQYDNEKITNIYDGVIETNLNNTIDSTLHN